MALPVLGVLATLAALGFPVYDAAVAGPRQKRAEKRTRRSEATTAALEEYLLGDEDRRADEITRALAVQRQQDRIDSVTAQQMQDPTGLGLTRMELEQVQAMAYRSRPGPGEVLAYFGVGG
jgi:hypothetical protein